MVEGIFLSCFRLSPILSLLVLSLFELLYSYLVSAVSTPQKSQALTDAKYAPEVAIELLASSNFA